MATTLSLTDGTVTINLVDGTNYESRTDGFWTPESNRDYQWQSLAPHGAALASAHAEPRTISIRFNILAANMTAVDTRLKEIQRMLDTASLQSQRGWGTGVTLTYQKNGSANATIFDVLTGRLILPSSYHSLVLSQFQILGVTLELDCKPFGRAAEAVALAATTLRNRNDAGGSNFVSIAAATFPGDVRSPLRVKTKHTTAAVTSLGRIWVAIRSRGTVANFEHTLDAQTAANGGDGVASGNGETDTADAACNNAYRVRIIAPNTTMLGHFIFAITTNVIDHFGTFRVLARIRTNAAAVTDVKMQLRTGDNFAWVTTTKQVNPTYVGSVWHLCDLGLVKFPTLTPPLTTPAGGQSQINILFEAQMPDTAKFLDVDSFTLLPVDEGAMEIRSDAADTNNSLYVDAIGDWTGRELIYLVAPDTQVRQAGSLLKTGRALWATPGRINRIYVIVSRAANNDVFNDTYDVSADVLNLFGMAQ